MACSQLAFVGLILTLALAAVEAGPGVDPTQISTFEANKTTTTPFVPTEAPPPTESLVGELKSSVLAGGWIPFAVILVLSCVFAFVYVRYYQHKREKEFGPTVISMLGLVVALLTTALIPVDIFLVSSFKAGDGTFHDWATDDIRSQVLSTLTDAYYAMYGLNVVFIFFLMPMAYFFFEEKDEVAGVTTGKRLLTAAKFTLGTLIVLGVLMCIGAFALNSDGSTCVASEKNGTDVKDWTECRAKYAEESLTKNGGTNALSFTVGVLAILGMGYFIFYTAFGLAELPIGLMRSRGRTSNVDLKETVTRTRSAREKQDAIRAKYSKRAKKMSDRDRDHLADEEEEERVLIAATEDLAIAENTCIAKTGRVLRPFSFVFGLLLILISGFLVVSLLLTCVDRLTQIRAQGLNFETGYTEAAPKLMNPVDTLMTYMQVAFPLDYIAMALLVFYFVVCTAAGIARLGIRFCFMKVFTIRPTNTVPQGLLCLVSVLMFTVLALNIVLLTLVPKYSTYGNQKYPVPASIGGVEGNFSAWGDVDSAACDSTAPNYIFYAYNASGRFLTRQDHSASGSVPNLCNEAVNIWSHGVMLNFTGMGCARMDACVPTRLSALLHAFFYNAWFFGAIYYWGNWAHVLVFFISLVYIIVKKRETTLQLLINDHRTNFDDDDEPAPFNPSWMR